MRRIMVSQADVRRIAMSLRGVVETTGRFGFAVPQKSGKAKAFVWAWLERIDPKRARVPSDTAIGIRVASLVEKEALLATYAHALFTEAHYNGYPAVLARLADLDDALLRDLLVDAWACVAPKALRAAALATLPAPDDTPKRARKPGRDG